MSRCMACNRVLSESENAILSTYPLCSLNNGCSRYELDTMFEFQKRVIRDELDTDLNEDY